MENYLNIAFLKGLIQTKLIEISDAQFRGFDPYDGCSSVLKVFQLNKYTRLFSQYYNKFSPLNMRALFGIRKQVFPQVLAYYGLTVFIINSEETFKKELDEAVQILLKESLTDKYGYNCWNSIGFPLQMLNGYSPVDLPDVVGGSLIGRFLIEYAKRYPSEILDNAILSQYKFFLNNLFVDLGTEGFIRYRPNQNQNNATYNASLLAAKYLMEVDNHYDTDNSKTVKKCFDFVVNRQQKTGEWYYTIDLNSGKEKKQVDFHQGFILDAILDYMEKYGFDQPYISAYEKGLDFYFKKQFLPSGQGLYRYPKKWPANIHNQSQGIITFSRASQFNTKFFDFANTIADWTLRNMKDKKTGNFYFLKYPFFSNKIPYLRWSESNMIFALASLLKQMNAK